MFLNAVSSVPLQQTMRHAGDSVFQLLLHAGAGQVPNLQEEAQRRLRWFSSAEHHDRYINAAKSLMAARLAVAAWGARVRPHPQKRGRHLAHNIDMMLDRCLIQ